MTTFTTEDRLSADQSYWLCCGSTEYTKHKDGCNEAQIGHPEHCRWGTKEEHRVTSQEPRHKDIMVCDFNLRFWEKDGEWVCSMPGWLLEVFEKEIEKGRISHD